MPNSTRSPDAEPEFGREHVRRVLRRSGVDEEQITRVLGELDFPLTLTALQDQLGRFGITRDFLISTLGGSP